VHWTLLTTAHGNDTMETWNDHCALKEPAGITQYAAGMAVSTGRGGVVLFRGRDTESHRYGKECSEHGVPAGCQQRETRQTAQENVGQALMNSVQCTTPLGLRYESETHP